MHSKAPPADRSSKGSPRRANGDSAWRALATLAVLAGLAAVFFYFYVIARFALDVPVEDDNDFLQFLLQWQRGDGPWLAFHNEHRPATARALFASTVLVQGHVDFRSVMFLGGAALVGLTALLFHWLPSGPLPRRLATFGPVVVLLFSLQHWQATLWATGAAQHYPTLLCAFAAFTLLARPTPSRIALAAGLATLALYDLGAGLFVFLVGLGLLLHARAWRGAAAFGLWGAVCTGFYFVGYARPAHHPSVFAALADPLAAFDYGCSLLGAGLSFDDLLVGWLARFVGVGLGLGFLFVLRDRRWRDEPEVVAGLCFLLLTLASVTITRVGFGLDQAFDSRYRIYSHLFMALLWISFVRGRAKALAERDADDAALEGDGDAIREARRDWLVPTGVALALAIALNVGSWPSARRHIKEHRAFYAFTTRDFGRGKSPIPGPARYTPMAKAALASGLWEFPCEAVGVEPSDPNPYCRGDRGATRSAPR